MSRVLAGVMRQESAAGKQSRISETEIKFRGHPEGIVEGTSNQGQKAVSARRTMAITRDENCPTPDPSIHTNTGRDPEDRPVNVERKDKVREKMLDKTIADSFPTSDPPSSIPNPSEDDSLAA